MNHAKISRKPFFSTLLRTMVFILIIFSIIILLHHTADAQTSDHRTITRIINGDNYSSTTTNFHTLHAHTLNLIVNEMAKFEENSQISVGSLPIYIAIGPSNTVYVANSGSDTVSVIDGLTNTKIKDIPVGNDPVSLAVDNFTDTIHVTNYRSNSISVIDDIANKVVSGVTFYINPVNTGHIICNNVDAPINKYFYLFSGTKYIAKPNKEYEFSSWVENLK